ncbi:MAG: GGDEF domain-containing protein [Firmicutes bacterium]|jgi:diguanylate cyclase (GGDEF)-like protein|nr:GGDEF domain-containing protein [Bacillota bacterium]
MITAPADLKAEYWVFLAGFLLPGVDSITYFAGFGPHGIYLAPYCFMATNVLLLIGLSPNQLFELVSLARNKVFDGMDDVVVIINRNNRVIDYSQSLNQIVPHRRKDHVDEHLSTLFKAHPRVAGFAMAHSDGEASIALDDGSGRVFKARIRTIRRRDRGMLVKYLTMTNITKEMTMVQAMNDLANIDALTGIANRRSFYNQMERFTDTQQAGSIISVIMLDVDHFKTVNDTCGHKAGDTLLREIASVLEQSIRAQDILARYGGEEFIIAVPGIGADDAVALARRLCERIDAFEGIREGQSVKVTASFGVACDTIRPAFDVELLIKNADAALYGAKNAGRNRVVFSAAQPD